MNDYENMPADVKIVSTLKAISRVTARLARDLEMIIEAFPLPDEEDVQSG